MGGAELTKILEEAAAGASGAADKFYRELLESSVFVPLQSAPVADKTVPFLTVNVGPAEVLPIFSEASFVAAWAKRDVPFEARSFKALLWAVKDEMLFHLNPGQECGKEITFWEIERLREGKEAIPEILAESGGRSEADIEIDHRVQQHEALKQHIKAVLEAYEPILGAFLIGVREEEKAEFSPVLGLVQQDMEPAALKTLADELQDIAAGLLPAHIPLEIVEDLTSEVDPRVGFFAEAQPFYVSPRASAEEE